MEDASITENFQRFNKFVDLAKAAFKTSQEGDITDPAYRVNFIKQTDPEDFFRLLITANGFLIGKRAKWRGEAVKSVVRMGSTQVVDLEPPDHAEQKFEEFYQQMRVDISPENLAIYSVKLYNAIILAHMFPDGNGRLARNFYSLLRTGNVLNEEKSNNRGKDIAVYAGVISQDAMLQVIHMDDISEKHNLVELEQEYVGVDYGDDPSILGLAKLMKYVAARRVLINHNQFDADQKIIRIDQWPSDLHHEYEEAYQQVCQQCFWEGLAVVDRYSEWCIETLDKALIVTA